MGAKAIRSVAEFEDAIRQGVSLVDFNAPWCAPCRAQGPIIQALSEKFEGRAIIAEINVDENRETAAKLGIRSIPTLTLFKDGTETRRFVGLQSASTLEKAIEENLTQTG